MSILPAVGVSVLCAVCALVLREIKSPVAPLITLLGGICLLLCLLPRAREALAGLEGIVGLLDPTLTETLCKVLCASLLVGIGCDACTELGAPTLAAKLDFFGKIEILLLSLPTLSELFSRVTGLLS